MALCPPKLKEELLDELRTLNFHGLVQTVAELLKRMGYEEVSPTARRDLMGRHRDGGCDVTAERSVIGGGRRSVVVQIKPFPEHQLIFRRTLDELRGVLLRRGAAEGILITTSGFSPSVDITEYSSAQIAPLRLIDGEELAGLLTLYRVGVMKVGVAEHESAARFQLDRGFFRKLTASASTRDERRTVLKQGKTRTTIRRTSVSAPVRCYRRNVAGFVITVKPQRRRS
jgi:restriction endonuclease Mrr